MNLYPTSKLKSSVSRTFSFPSLLLRDSRSLGLGRFTTGDVNSGVLVLDLNLQRRQVTCLIFGRETKLRGV